MADEKKPRKLKDLRARLGKSGGGKAASAASAQGAEPVAPPPSLGQAPVPPAMGGAPAPGAASNPFAPKPKTRKPSDPFVSAAPSTAQREVRIVMDETPVEDAEIGRRKRFVSLGLLLGGAVIGLAVALAISTVNAKSINWNRGVRSAKALYHGVQATSERVTEAQSLLETIKTAAKGSPGTPAKVDYDAIQALLALPNPAEDHQVALNQNYSLLALGTVGPVQGYYHQVGALWQRIGILRLQTGENRRNDLDAAASSTQNIAKPIGCVPAVVENRFVCNLQFLFIQEDGTVKSGPRATTSDAKQEAKRVFTGEGTGLGEAPTEHVIIVNNESSVGVLGQQADAFAQFNRLILEMEQLVGKITEVQSQVESSLGPVAGYEERFALFDDAGEPNDGSH